MSAWRAGVLLFLLPGAQAVGAPPAELRAGVTLESALATLNARGYRIVYSSALVTESMVLSATPRAVGMDALLAEILAPWKLRAVHAANGDWLVVAAPQEELAQPATSLLAPPDIESIDVTASRFGLATPGTSAVFVDRATVERLPHLADDAIRMLKLLPGVSGGDFSAALNVRGGRRDESMLMIDGAEIHGGFHFRDLDGALSVLDTNLVESIDFTSGGMTAEHGDYMSGAVELRTRRPRPEDAYRSALGVSFVSAYGRTGGSFDEGRGAWLASARRGYLDVLMDRVQDENERITPRYQDVFASLYYDFDERAALEVHALLSGDDLELVQNDDEAIDSMGRGRANHVWATLDQEFGDSMRVRTLVSAARMRQSRRSAGEDDDRYGDVRSEFDARFFELRHGWSWSPDEQDLLRFGANTQRSQARYDYALAGGLFYPPAPGGVIDRSHSTELDVSGDRIGLYGSWRRRFGNAFTAEAGARWDEYRYPGAQVYDVVSPRLNFVYQSNDRNAVRIALGVVHQPQGIDELQVEDDVTTFHEPERSRQAVLGFTHRLSAGMSIRIDLYQKHYEHLRARFENALDPVQLIPEGAIDRVRIDAPEAEAHGIELTLRREAERGTSGWLSVALARARERDLQAGWVARTWEQRSTASFGLSWTGARWNWSAAGLYHSGMPTTRVELAEAELPGDGGPIIVTRGRNAARLGNYLRLDVRVNRDVHFASSKLALYVEVTNLLDRDNPCCIGNFEIREDSGGRSALAYERSNWLPMLPSFGFQYEF